MAVLRNSCLLENRNLRFLKSKLQILAMCGPASVGNLPNNAINSDTKLTGFFSTLPKNRRSAPAIGDTCPGRKRAAPNALMARLWAVSGDRAGSVD